MIFPFFLGVSIIVFPFSHGVAVVVRFGISQNLSTFEILHDMCVSFFSKEKIITEEMQ